MTHLRSIRRGRVAMAFIAASTIAALSGSAMVSQAAEPEPTDIELAEMPATVAPGDNVPVQVILDAPLPQYGWRVDLRAIYPNGSTLPVLNCKIYPTTDCVFNSRVPDPINFIAILYKGNVEIDRAAAGPVQWGNYEVQSIELTPATVAPQGQWVNYTVRLDHPLASGTSIHFRNTDTGVTTARNTGLTAQIYLKPGNWDVTVWSQNIGVGNFWSEPRPLSEPMAFTVDASP